jgi:site-specific DNA-methyltransferase (adenine-specific)
MEIKNVKITKLKGYHQNNKRHPQEQIDELKKSLTAYGFIQPIVVDKENVVIIGHGRLEAAKQLAYTEVPAVQLDQLTEEQVRRLRLLDNRLSDLGEYDIDNIMFELDDLNDPELNALFKDLIPDEELPEEEEGSGDHDEKPEKTLEDLVIVVTQPQRAAIETALEEAKKIPYSDAENNNPNGNALYVMAAHFITKQK